MVGAAVSPAPPTEASAAITAAGAAGASEVETTATTAKAKWPAKRKHKRSVDPAADLEALPGQRGGRRARRPQGLVGGRARPQGRARRGVQGGIQNTQGGLACFLISQGSRTQKAHSYRYKDIPQCVHPGFALLCPSGRRIGCASYARPV